MAVFIVRTDGTVIDVAIVTVSVIRAETRFHIRRKHERPFTLPALR